MKYTTWERAQCIDWITKNNNIPDSIYRTMDKKIAHHVHRQFVNCSAAIFLENYNRLHRDKYGSDFEIKWRKKNE